MNIDFNKFMSSVGKRHKFEIVFSLNDYSTFTDVFFAYLINIFYLMNQHLKQVYDNYNR